MLPSRSAPAPFYEKVKQEISEKIASGIWQPHDRIPSEAELVAQYGFSRISSFIRSFGTFKIKDNMIQMR